MYNGKLFETLRAKFDIKHKLCIMFLMNRVGEAVKAQLNNVKALAALGGVTVAALISGGPLAPIAAATPARAPRAEGAHAKKAIPLEGLGSLGQQTVVQMVEQKPEAFYNGELSLNLRQRWF